MLFRGMIIGAVMLVSAPTQAQQPQLAGLWQFNIDTPQRTALGAFTLKPEGTGWRGRLITDGGIEGLEVKSVTLEGAAMVMHVISPNGEIVFRGRLNPGARSFDGIVTYHEGRIFPMRGIRQEPLPAPASASR